MSSLSDEQQSPRSRHVKTTVATITIVFSSFSNDLFQPALDKLIACGRLGTHYATECDLPSGRMWTILYKPHMHTDSHIVHVKPI